MASEVELERLVVKLVGDGSSYQKMLKEAQAETAAAGKKIGGGMQEAAGHAEKLNLSMRDSRHAIHLLGATTGLEGVTRPAMMGVYAYHLMEKGIHAATAALGTFGTLAIGAGIGIAVGGIAALVHWWEEVHKAEEMANEAAAKGFQEYIKGTKSAETALADMKKTVLEEGFGKAMSSFINPGWMESASLKLRAFMNVLTLQNMKPGGGAVKESGSEIVAGFAKKDLDKAINQSIEASERIQEAWEKAMSRPEIMAKTAMANLAAESSKLNDEVTKQVATFGMGEVEAKKYGMALELVAKGAAKDMDEALGIVNEKLEVYTEAKRALERLDITKEAVKLGVMGEAIDMAADKAAILRKQIEYALKHPGMSLAEAAKELKPLTDAMQEDFDRNEKKKQRLQLLDIENRRKLIFLSKSQAEAEKLIQDYMKEHPDRTRKQAETALGPALGALSSEASDKMIKSLQDDLQKVNVEFQKVGKSKEDAFDIDLMVRFKQQFGDISQWSLDTKINFESFSRAGRDALVKLEGAKLFEQVKTPIEKYADKIKDIDRLLAKGAITQETYNRAVMATRKEMFGASNELNKFDAAATGSVEALFRLQDQHRAIHDNPLDFHLGGAFPSSRPEISPSATGSADAAVKITESTQVQRQMLDVLKKIDAKGSIKLQPAGLF